MPNAKNFDFVIRLDFSSIFVEVSAENLFHNFSSKNLFDLEKKILRFQSNHDSQRLKIGAGCACLARTDTHLRIKYNTQNLTYQIYHN